MIPTTPARMTAAEAARRLTSAQARGDALAVRHYTLTHAYHAWDEAREAARAAWRNLREAEEAETRAYAEGANDLPGGGDCPAAIAAEVARENVRALDCAERIARATLAGVQHSHRDT